MTGIALNDKTLTISADNKIQINGVDLDLGSSTAADTTIDASGFTGNLNDSITDVQALAKAINDMVLAEGIDASGFSGNLDVSITTLQALADFIDGWDAGSALTETPDLSVSASGTESTDVIVTIRNYDPNAAYLNETVTGGTLVWNNDDTYTWTLPANEVDEVHTVSMKADADGRAISDAGTANITVTTIVTSADQVILYENTTMTGTQFPTLVDVDNNSSTLYADADNASATSAVVEQDVGDGEFTNAVPTVDSKIKLFTLANATVDSVDLSGESVLEGDIVLVGSDLVKLDTTGKLTVSTNTLDISSLNLTEAPTMVAKDTAKISTSIVASGAVDGFVERGVVSYTGGGTGVFTGYPCEFDYFNAYHKHNITQETTVDSLGGTFVADGVLSEIKSRAHAVVTKSRVYLLGGYNGSAYTDTIISAPINEDGTLGAWESDGVLKEVKAFAQAVVTKSRVYLLGGYNGSAYTDTIISAPINEDGTLGVWASDGVLSEIKSHAQAVVTKSRVYLLGGRDGSAYTDSIISAPIDADGIIGAWESDGVLSEIKSRAHAVVTKSRVYLLGGYDGSAYTKSTISAPINEDGTLGAWESDGVLKEVKAFAQAVVTKSRVYLLGGYNGSAYTDTIISAPINEDGTLGVWASDGVLSEIKSHAQAVVTKSRVYLLGGRDGSAYTDSIISAPIDADGIIGAWESDGVLSETKGLAQAVVTESRVYLLGGYDGSATTDSVISAPFADGWEITGDGYYAGGTGDPDKITTLFDADTRTGTDFKVKVDLLDSGDEVTRISVPIDKVV